MRLYDNWNIWCVAGDSRCYYHIVAPENEIDITTLRLVKKRIIKNIVKCITWHKEETMLVRDEPLVKLIKFMVAGILVLVLLLVLFNPVSSQTVRIVFLHHSCGHNLIEQGSVRQGLTALGYAFYDHGYNGDGLRLADGSYTGENYDVPGDNTDPDGLAEVFSQPLDDPPDNTFSYLMQYDVIAFKSCFPNSNISSDDMLQDYRRYYLSMRDRMDQYPDKLFIIVTQPPQVPNNTDKNEGRRAREFTEWLQSDEYLSGHPNIFVFDFFGYLAANDNFLRSEYRVDNWDAHPNERANQEIGPLFVSFIDEAIRGFGGDFESSEPAEPQAEEEEAEEGRRRDQQRCGSSRR